eukprot:scaffold886_cov174-Ochromonas_danica.AAC.8
MGLPKKKGDWSTTAVLCPSPASPACPSPPDCSCLPQERLQRQLARRAVSAGRSPSRSHRLPPPTPPPPPPLPLTRTEHHHHRHCPYLSKGAHLQQASDGEEERRGERQPQASLAATAIGHGEHSEGSLRPRQQRLQAQRTSDLSVPELSERPASGG